MIDRVLVLAAGHSTRIAALAGGTPKPLLEIAGKSIIGRTLEWLAGSGVRHAWVNLHYRADDIREVLGTGRCFGVSLAYSYEPTILGTAGAWKRVAARWSGTSLVVYGDNLLRFDLARFLAAHEGARRAHGVLATLALFDPGRHPHTGIAGGRVRLDERGIVAGFVEGPVPRSEPIPSFVNAGAYLLEPGVLDHIGDGAQDFGRDVFPSLVTAGRLAGYIFEPAGYCLGLDTPECFTTARELMRTGQVTLA